jgi:hypothetical protein
MSRIYYSQIANFFITIFYDIIFNELVLGCSLSYPLQALVFIYSDIIITLWQITTILQI